MPVSITDSSSFDAITAPAGSDVPNAASVVTPVQNLANRTRFLLDKALGGVTVWPRVGVARIASLASAQPDNTGGTGWFLTRPHWTATTYALQYLICPVNDIIDTGEIITAFDSLLKPGAARNGAGGTGDRMFVDLCYVAHDWLTPAAGTLTVIGSTHDDGTATDQRCVSSSVTHTVDLALNDYFFRVRAGSDADVHPDLLYALRVNMTKPTL